MKKEKEKNITQHDILLLIGYVLMVLMLFIALFHAKNIEENCEQITQGAIDYIITEDQCVQKCYGGIHDEQNNPVDWESLFNNSTSD